ncbi:MAG: GAF domain-containing protein [Anaerolineae bacterium]|nr:MAG: GAF domain-containing protein [Anaerolineae bacterium]
MMRRFFSITPSPVGSEIGSLQEYRSRILNILLTSGAVLGTIVYVFTMVQNIQSGKWGLFPVYTLLYLWVVIAAAGRRIRYTVRAATLPIVLYLLAIAVALDSGLSYSVGAFLLGFIAISAIFLGGRGGLASLLIGTATLAAFGFLASRRFITFPFPPTPASQTDPLYWTIGTFITFLIGLLFTSSAAILIRTLNASLQRAHTLLGELQEERQELAATARNLERRNVQIRTASEISRLVASVTDPDEVIRNAVDLLQERFDLYYVAIFLLTPDGRYAELQYASGEVGRILKESGHRLEIGGKSMVGMAIATHRPRIALDVGEEPVRFDNPLLPYTRSEIALPLMVGDRLLGALDIQSSEEAAFGEEDIEIFQGIATQVAIALENARLFRETQENLRELEAAHRQYLRSAWADALSDKDRLEYVAETGGAPPPDKENRVDIPLVLREQIIGDILLEGGEEWSEEDQEWLEAIATQAALALENARLLEESQETALRERLVAEIVSKVWSATTVDGVLQTTIRELGRALNADEALIELSTPATNGGNGDVSS